VVVLRKDSPPSLVFYRITNAVLIAFHKPYGILSQFTPEPGSKWGTLAEFGFPPRVYPIGRLDADSEGLLLLSDEPEWNAKLLHPSNAHEREYWALVERIPTTEALETLRSGVVIGGQRTLPCRVAILDPQPEVAPRDPPVRVRKTVMDCWMSLALVEGKYHQVRKMTAAVGHPTLRLLRVRIGGLELGALARGAWHELGENERRHVAQVQL
jgi:23S rRNA pseudouridine2457 synthase